MRHVVQFFRLAWNVLHANLLLTLLLSREKNSCAKRTGISFFNRISGRTGIWLARNFVRAPLRFPCGAIGVHKTLTIHGSFQDHRVAIVNKHSIIEGNVRNCKYTIESFWLIAPALISTNCNKFEKCDFFSNMQIADIRTQI